MLYQNFVNGTGLPPGVWAKGLGVNTTGGFPLPPGPPPRALPGYSAAAGRSLYDSQNYTCQGSAR